MGSYTFKSEIAPPAVVYVPNGALPTANTDLFPQVTIVGPITKIGAFEVKFSSTVGGTLKLVRTANSVTVNETLNGGTVVTANVPTDPEIVTFAGGEVIGMIYSGASGTFNLTIADVSGEKVQRSKS